MKTHDNHLLLGRIRMKKNKSSETKQIEALPLTNDPISENVQQIALDDAARIYRESIMHLNADGPTKTA